MRVLKANLCSVLLGPPPQAAPQCILGRAMQSSTLHIQPSSPYLGCPWRAPSSSSSPPSSFPPPLVCSHPSWPWACFLTRCVVMSPHLTVLFCGSHILALLLYQEACELVKLCLCTAQREWWFINFESLC